MISFIYMWLISFSVGLIIDIAWLSVMVSQFYMPYLGHLFTGSFKYEAALLFYSIYSAAITYLIVVPHLQSNSSLMYVMISGFIMGLAAYGAYDLTNHATLKDWPLIVTIVDMLWGATVTSLTCGISYTIIKTYFIK